MISSLQVATISTLKNYIASTANNNGTLMRVKDLVDDLFATRAILIALNQRENKKQRKKERLSMLCNVLAQFIIRKD